MSSLISIIVSFFKVLFIISLLSGILSLSICLLLIVSIIVGPFIFSLRLKKSYPSHKLTDMRSLIFMPYCKLPLNKNLFKYNKHSLYLTCLPNIDMNNYDFTNVSLYGCRFSKNTILPRDSEFFQKIAQKDLTDVVLPEGDYSFYNFDGVNLSRTTFRKKSILPQQSTLFKNSKFSNCIQITLPESFGDYCHLYDLEDVRIYPLKKINISESQKYILYKKYGNNMNCLLM